MPFGIADPQKRISNSEHEVEPLVGCVCGICGKDESAKYHDGSLFPLAPVIIPKNPNGLHSQRMVFICAVCYSVRNKHDFQSLDEFRAVRNNRINRIGRPSGSINKATQVKKSRADVSTKIDDMHRLLKMICIKLSIPLDCSPQEHSELKPLEPLESSETDDDDAFLDDLEFGMTEDQQRRMAEAVKIAEARTREVPKEEWNFEDRL